MNNERAGSFMEEANTPYDDVFHTLFMECDDLVIPFINEIFHEKYTLKDQIIRSANEHYLEQQGGREEKRVTDSLLRIVKVPKNTSSFSTDKDSRDDKTGRVERKYHIECESSHIDGTLLIRFFEYDTQIALDEGKVEDFELVVEFPKSAVILLRSRKTAVQEMKITMKAGENQMSYPVQVVKLRDYGMEEIFERKLYFLLPFLIFNRERELEEINREDEKLKSLLDTYRNMSKKLEKLAEAGEISYFSYVTLRDMTNRVVCHLAKKYQNVTEGVGKIMGGQVLDFEAKRIKDGGIKIGETRGIKIGETMGETNISEVIVLLSNGMPENQIVKKGYSLSAIQMAKNTLKAIGYFPKNG